MPIHDWTRVAAGIFHAFHHSWIEELSRALNRGLLPKGFYALPEQVAGGPIADVLTLEGPTNGVAKIDDGTQGSVATAIARPQVSYHTQTEQDQYAIRAKAIGIRHVSNHEVIAMIEVVSPGNKASKHALRTFVDKAAEMLRAGIHLLIVDLFPPGPRDPHGLHKAIWDEFHEKDYTPPAGKPLTLASYIGGPVKEAFVEPVAVGLPLPEMPLFLTSHFHVMVPMEATYSSAWDAVPEFWRDVLTGKQK